MHTFIMIRYVLILLLIGWVPVHGQFETCNCECEDLDREKLGTSTWYLLHEIVKHGDDEYEHAFRTMMHTLSVLYPCKECRSHLKEYLGTHRVEMSEPWLCGFHNEVNVRLGKPVFNCTV